MRNWKTPENRARAKRWREENPERYREAQRKWRRENAEYTRQKNREYYLANKERIKARNKAWRERHPERTRELKRLAEARRRAGMKGSVSVEQAMARVEYYGFQCWMCGGDWEEFDHVIPLSLGGLHLASNIRPACSTCNQSKGNKCLSANTLSAKS